MADADAEAAFLSSMRVMNEGAGKYENTNDASAQQIDSSSSDEYDPAPDVQEITLSPDPKLPSQSNQPSSVDTSDNDISHSISASTRRSPAPVNGVAAMASLSQSVVPNGDTIADTPQASAQQSMVTDSPVTVQHDALPTLTTAASASIVGAATHDDSVPVPNMATKNNAAVESPNVVVPSKARLPHDRVGLLEDRIKEDERGDLDAWLNLIGEHRKRDKVEEARKVYGRFFGVFPWAVSISKPLVIGIIITSFKAEQWVAYTQLENDAQNRPAVEAIFQKTLQELPSLELWKAYLTHIRRYFSLSADKTGTASQINDRAYQAVLGAVGIDKEAGNIWQDYLQFIKSGPGVPGGTTWQDQQKMDTLRKAYQDAICVPTQAVESLWREYNAFEMGLNKLTVRYVASA